jgi:hypothetical protein
MSDHSPDPAKQLRKALMSIREHYPHTLESHRSISGAHVKTSTTPSLPIAASTLDTRATARRRLAFWAWATIAGRDLHTEHLYANDVGAMCDLLIRHSEWLGQHDEAPIAVFELQASASELRNLAAPHRRDWMSLGTCPLVTEVDVDGVMTPMPCTGTIRAYPDADPYCDVCLTSAVVDWWEHKQFPSIEHTTLLTGPQLVVFIHHEFGRVVAPSTVRKWVERGLISTSGIDDAGRTLYDKAIVAYTLTRRAEAMA